MDGTKIARSLDFNRFWCTPLRRVKAKQYGGSARRKFKRLPANHEATFR